MNIETPADEALPGDEESGADIPPVDALDEAEAGDGLPGDGAPAVEPPAITDALPVRLSNNHFSRTSRIDLLNVLQQACRDTGVDVRYESCVSDPAALEENRDASIATALAMYQTGTGRQAVCEWLAGQCPKSIGTPEKAAKALAGHNSGF